MRNKTTQTTVSGSYLFRVAAAGVIVIALSGMSLQRNAVWHTYLSLWEDTVQKTPGKSRVHNSMGNTYVLLGRHADAVREYKVAIALDQMNFEAYYNIANNLEQLGFPGEAAYYYDFFCKAAPIDYPDAVKSACEQAAQLTIKSNERAR